MSSCTAHHHTPRSGGQLYRYLQTCSTSPTSSAVGLRSGSVRGRGPPPPPVWGGKRQGQVRCVVVFVFTQHPTYRMHVGFPSTKRPLSTTHNVHTKYDDTLDIIHCHCTSQHRTSQHFALPLLDTTHRHTPSHATVGLRCQWACASATAPSPVCTCSASSCFSCSSTASCRRWHLPVHPTLRGEWWSCSRYYYYYYH